MSSEHIIEAIIREHIYRHKLHDAIDAFEKEEPLKESSLTTRAEIIKSLKLESTMKKFKHSNKDTKGVSLLEIMVWGYLRRKKKKKKHVEGAIVPGNINQMLMGKLKERQEVHVESSMDGVGGEGREQLENDNMERSGGGRKKIDILNYKFDKFSRDDKVTRDKVARDKFSRDKDDSIVLEDVEDDLFDVPIISTSVQSTPIDERLGKKLRMMILGPSRPFDHSWIAQGFGFNDRDVLWYGIVQHEGGSCGVLAAVQGHILSRLFCMVEKPELTDDLRNKVLVESLADILWRIHTCSKNPVCVAHGKLRQTQRTPDFDFTSISFTKCTTREQVVSNLVSNLSQYRDPKGIGVILLIISAVLTASVEGIEKDMDYPTSLIVEYNYCSQELVNLLLIGRAISHVHDGYKLMGKRGERTKLKGLQSRSDIGFLTLFEANGHIEVGDWYKNPKYSVWVIFSESHYSCLFIKEKHQNNVLTYYDGLSNQKTEIHLKINPNGNGSKCKDEIVPPLNQVIQTKWKGHQISWNVDPHL